MVKTEKLDSERLPDLLDIPGLAKHLGVNVRHIRRLVFERRIPFVKWGRLIRFDPDEIAVWLDAARVPDGRPVLRRQEPITRAAKR